MSSASFDCVLQYISEILDYNINYISISVNNISFILLDLISGMLYYLSITQESICCSIISKRHFTNHYKLYNFIVQHHVAEGYTCQS